MEEENILVIFFFKVECLIVILLFEYYFFELFISKIRYFEEVYDWNFLYIGEEKIFLNKLIGGVIGWKIYWVF